MSDVRQKGTSSGTVRVPAQRGQEPTAPTAWAGWVVFGAMMMIAMGAFHAVAGLVALFNNSYYTVATSRLVVTVDYSTWGWVHLAFGVVALAAGLGLMSGAMWARVLGVAVASLSMVVSFAFIPAAPVWATMIIVLDALVLFAIIAHGNEVADFQS